MHEFTVANTLLRFLKKLCTEKKAHRVTKVKLTVNPYSCLDEENLNFVFSSLARNNPKLARARIRISRSKNPAGREITIEQVELLT